MAASPAEVEAEYFEGSIGSQFCEDVGVSRYAAEGGRHQINLECGTLGGR